MRQLVYTDKITIIIQIFITLSHRTKFFRNTLIQHFLDSFVHDNQVDSESLRADTLFEKRQMLYAIVVDRIFGETDIGIKFNFLQLNVQS